jgi:hypothetical protein
MSNITHTSVEEEEASEREEAVDELEAVDEELSLRCSVKLDLTVCGGK